ncbi:ABC transporter substrate-binding protein [Paenibacillus tarimensis]
MASKFRYFTFLLALIMFISLLSACSRPDNGNTNQPNPGTETNDSSNGNTGDPVSKNVTLDFWTIALSPNFDDYINGRIAKYEQENPGVKIKWTDLPFTAIENKLLTSIAAGKSPDVVNLNTNMALTLASKGALVDMNKEATVEQRGIYFEDMYSSASIGDSAFAFPWYIAPHVLMYNKKIYEAAGLDPNGPPVTWDEVKSHAAIIKEKTGKYAFVPTVAVYADLVNAGVPVISEDKTKVILQTPEALSYAKWMKSLYDEDLVPKDGITGGYTFALNQFQAGEIAMLISGSQFLNRVKQNAADVYENTLVADVPTQSSGNIHAPLMNVVVPTMSDTHEEAIAFANYITNDESQLEFSKIVNIFPSTKEAAKDPFFTLTGEDPESKAKVIAAASLPRAIDVTFGVPDQGELISILTKEWEKMQLGQQSPEDTLKNAEEQMQKKLDEINSNY